MAIAVSVCEDIAILTGGQAIMKERLQPPSYRRDARSRQVCQGYQDNTTIVDGNGTKEAINDRINQIKGEIENTTSDFDREKLRSAWQTGRRRGSHQGWCGYRG